MKVFFPRESDVLEKRTAVTPSVCAKWKTLGIEILCEDSVGLMAGFRDIDYDDVTFVDRLLGATSADIIVSVHPQSDLSEIIKPGAIHISLLDVYSDAQTIASLRQRATVFSLEKIPRTTFAQKMDVISSQASIAGYSAVIQSITQLGSVVPMMTTPAGTIVPQRFLIIGAGVAGLQAIATARRLGANVEAFDTRTEVEEQVKSLGAKFLKIDLGETGSTQQGYARMLTEEQLAKQREGLLNACRRADVVISTAKVFGKKAPVIITASMLDAMKYGVWVIDLAVSHGGNVEGSVAEKIVTRANGVSIWGMAHAESAVAKTASEMFAANIYNFAEHFCREGNFVIDESDDILKACLEK